MSKIVWSNTFLPPESEPVKEFSSEFYPNTCVPETQCIPEAENKIVKLPDRRAYRSMSRAAVLLSAVSLPAKEILAKFLEEDLYSVGVYCAMEQGTTHFESCHEMKDLPFESPDFAETYRKLRTPKMFLRQLPNLAPAQLGIFLDARGPMNVYVHSKHGVSQALSQAEFDLKEGVIKAALVCSAGSFEDPLIVYREKKDKPAQVLREGAGAMILTKDETVTDWASEIASQDSDHNYGIATDLITNILRR